MTIKELSKQPRVAELLRAKQDEMEAALSANRRVMPHEGEKGAARNCAGGTCSADTCRSLFRRERLRDRSSRRSVPADRCDHP